MTAQPPVDELLAGEPPDLRLLLPAAAAWLAAGATIGWSSRAGLTVALVLIGVAVGAWLLAGGRRAGGRLGARRWWALVLAAAALCAAGSAAAAAWRVAAIHRGPLPALARADAKVSLELVIGSDPKQLFVAVGTHGARRSIVILSAKALEVTTVDGVTTSIRSPVFVLAGGHGWLELQPSEHVRASGRLGVPQPGEFETATFDATGSPSTVGRASPVQRIAGQVRASLRAATAPLPAGPGGLLPGLVDGDVARLPPQVEADFKTTGLTHLVAVSGANVAIVLGAVLVVARWTGLRVRGQACAGVLVIVAFVVVARPQPSVLRAAAMGLVAVVALSTGRRKRALPALSAAVLCLIYVDPTLARSVGFALSVLATGALVVVAPRLRDHLAQVMPRRLAEALSVPTAATLVCAPVIASISGSVSLVAIPANLLAEPVVGVATILGVLTACIAPFWLTGATLLARLGAVPCSWLVFVAHTFAHLPGASLPWPSGSVGALDLVGVVGLFALAARLLWHAATRAADARND
ncbi:MAG: ComEC/Rec2 family competence protein [Acidothermaceae bacterium]